MRSAVVAVVLASMEVPIDGHQLHCCCHSHYVVSCVIVVVTNHCHIDGRTMGRGAHQWDQTSSIVTQSDGNSHHRSAAIMATEWMPVKLGQQKML